MLNFISEKLKIANQLYNQGLYNEALDALTEFEHKIVPNSEDHIYCLILKSDIFHELGRSTDALEHAEQAEIDKTVRLSIPDRNGKAFSVDYSFIILSESLL